jgi:hypothetical protein
VRRAGALSAQRLPVEKRPVIRERKEREVWRGGVAVARWHYNFSFVVEGIKAEKWLKMGGEGRRKWGNDPAR